MHMHRFLISPQTLPVMGASGIFFATEVTTNDLHSLSCIVDLRVLRRFVFD